MAKDSERFDETCTHAERPAVAVWSQNRRRCSAICPQPLAPSHTPRVSHSPRQAAKAPHRSPKSRCGATYFGAHGLARLASKPEQPALHRRMALALTAAVDRSRAADLGDELKKTCKSSSGPATPSASGRSRRANRRTRHIAWRSSLPGKADRDGTQALPVTIDLII